METKKFRPLYNNHENRACKICGCTEFYLERNERHLGVYCVQCDKWLKWSSQNKTCKLCNFFQKGTRTYKHCVFNEDLHELSDIKVDCDKFHIK